VNAVRWSDNSPTASGHTNSFSLRRQQYSICRSKWCRKNSSWGIFGYEILKYRGRVHRIAAQRSLVLKPDVIPPSLEIAQKRLHYGNDNAQRSQKNAYRFKSKPETHPLNDFDHVLAALYAENNDVSIAYRQQCLANPNASTAPPPAHIDTLKAIWERVLPHRELIVLSGNVKTKTQEGHEYSAAEMSDGERVVFYLIAQALLAKSDSLLIFDEPELHINRSILAKLWDEIEGARTDCGFLYITHDVEFAGSRHAAEKYALRSYQKLPTEGWDIEHIPEDSSLPDDVLVSIIGSRSPVLFVEGDGGSLDSALYRRVYSGFTVIPVGSCEQVIQTVATFVARPALHRIGCAGLIDLDGRTDEEATYLTTKGVFSLSVSEVENVLLLPNVFLAIAKDLKFNHVDANTRLSNLKTYVLDKAALEKEAICLRYTRRRIDAEMKKIGLLSTDIQELRDEFAAGVAVIDVQTFYDDILAVIDAAIQTKNYEKVLSYYDNKGLLAEVARQLGYGQKALVEFLGRALRSDDCPDLLAALTTQLPCVAVQG